MENLNQIQESRSCETAKLYKKSSYVDVYEALQSLRNCEFFCDVKLETDDKKIIYAHKVVLSSASAYFHSMFTNFVERNQDYVVMREIDSTALLLIVNFIYSGQILITEENIQGLLPAANLLQLQEIKDACCDFLKLQLSPMNCIGINAIADLYSCTKLFKSSELYIEQNFSEVIGNDEFLSLSSEQVIELISSDKLTVPTEEKVFESVVRWVKHDFGTRECIFPQLMEHVRLPLISKNYILKKVVEDPLVKNCLKCNHYVTEALYFHTLNPEEPIPQNIRNKYRYGDKVILVVGGGIKTEVSTEWYDPKTNQWHYGPETITSSCTTATGLAVVKDILVFNVGGSDFDLSPLRSVEVLDLSSKSPCWKPTVDMLVEREYLRVGVINNNLYAVGGYNHRDGYLKSAEVFDYNIQEWRMISCMSIIRSDFGVGVLKNLLYAVGGRSRPLYRALDSVEVYNPSNDTWTPVAKMCVCRRDVGVGVLDGVLYAVGGHDGSNVLSSVETYRPTTGVWTCIADMHLPRRNAEVVTLDGLLYVVGGMNQSFVLDSVEYYNPNNKTWTMVTASMNNKRVLAGVVAINRPQLFTN